MEELIESFARQIARARFGPGVDMGGKHNPLPSEYRLAKEMAEEASSVFKGCPYDCEYCQEW